MATATKQEAGLDLDIREGLEGLTPARIITLYRRAPLLRPVSDPERIWSMFENASLVLTAWHGGQLVGIARVLTDGVLYSYLCDLAVEPDVQRLGVGKALIYAITPISDSNASRMPGYGRRSSGRMADSRCRVADRALLYPTCFATVTKRTLKPGTPSSTINTLPQTSGCALRRHERGQPIR